MNERKSRRKCRGRCWHQGILGLCAWLLLACGGSRGEEPTPLPANAVVPDQPTVVFPTFTPIQPAPTLTPVPPPAEQPTPTWTPFVLPTLDTSRLILDALAIPQQVVALHTVPNGEVAGNVPSDQILTAVARSRDGNWLAVYTEDFQKGWVALAEVNLYGGDQLPVADTIPERSDLLGSVREVTVEDTRLPLDPQAQDIGTITGDGLRIRNAPTTEGSVLGSLSRDAEISVLGRDATGSWLKISLWGTPAAGAVAEDTGWVFAQYVQLDGDLSTLPVTD